MEAGENRLSFIKHVEITNGKVDTIYSTSSNEIEKCGGVQFESDRVSAIIGHKKVASKLKWDNT